MSSSIDAGIKWRPKPSEVAEIGSEFQEYWDSYFANAPDKPVLWIGLGSAFVLRLTLFVKTLIITIVQAHRGSYRGPSAQILHLGCIHREPTYPRSHMQHT